VKTQGERGLPRKEQSHIDAEIRFLSFGPAVGPVRRFCGGDGRGHNTLPESHRIPCFAGRYSSNLTLDLFFQVAIDPIVIYLLGAVCTFAFVPPCVCKLRQMFCTVSEQVGDEYGMSPEGY